MNKEELIMVRYDGTEYLGGEGMYALYEPQYTCICDRCGNEDVELYEVGCEKQYCRDCVEEEFLEKLVCDECGEKQSGMDYYYLIDNKKKCACEKCAESYFSLPADEIDEEYYINCSDCGDCDVIGTYEGKYICKYCFEKTFPEV